MPKRLKLPETLRARVELEAAALVEALHKKYIKKPPKNREFNYLVEIHSKWHAGCFYLCSKYACPSPRAISPYFETCFARLMYVSVLGREGRLELSYKRYTGEWIRVFSGSATACMREILNNELFTP
ncbi:TPA: hypothetical protein HA243_06640 [Candidatus Micrarchaeota archaeon]|nr:hypothetical protein [Candidatus Micrarchaeota archaeon]